MLGLSHSYPSTCPIKPAQKRSQIPPAALRPRPRRPDPLDHHGHEPKDRGTDGVNNLHVSVFVTASNHKIMLLHPGRSENNIKHFFQDIYEVWTKHLMGTFVKVGDPVESKAFDQRVRSIGLGPSGGNTCPRG